MKKHLLFIFILLLLTGCKVEYKITLNNKLELEENIVLTPTTQEDKDQFNDFTLNIPIDKEIYDYELYAEKIDSIEYYDITKNKEKISIGYKYNNKKYTEYINSRLINQAYEYISISKVDEKYLVLSTSKEFLLFDAYDNLEEVKITINTKYKVLSHNADKVNNHDYTWIITKDNAYGKGIYLKLDQNKEDLTFLEKLIKGKYLDIFIIAIIILSIGFAIYILLKNKNKKINEI